MKCPHCNYIVHLIWVSSFSREISYKKGEELFHAICPQCNQLILLRETGAINYQMFNTSGSNIIYEINNKKKIIFPLKKPVYELPAEVPNIYKEDFEEATNVLSISPKSSAALSRRCLQNFFHEELKIKKKNLSLEIDAFINEAKAPSYINEAVHAIRQYGNFSTHPIEDKVNGGIIAIEDGEAEWLLEILHSLFDFYFVLPKLHEKRKEVLNEKLKLAGKPEMK